MDKMVLIDGNAIIHRAYHALPPLKNKQGQLVNSVYGFASLLLKVIRELEPKYFICAFDLAGPTFRQKQFKEYKAKRVKPPQELYDQIPQVKELVRAFNIQIYEKEGWEADDVIGTIAQKTEDKKNIENIIVSGDLDTLQLVTPLTKVYFLRGGIKEAVLYDEEGVFERYQLKPEQIIDLKGLQGDASDNIPGVPGVGQKTALDLLQKYQDINRLYEKIEEADDISPRIKTKLLEYKDQAFLSQDLATIRKNVSLGFKLEDCLWQDFSRKKIIHLFEELGFRSLVNRLPEQSML